MVLHYARFEMPEAIEIEQASDTFARFVIEPFERGFGHTLGNTLRRVMLTSLEAPAIRSMRIEGMSHEFMALDGVVEDGTTIVLNLKGALLRRSASCDLRHDDCALVTSIVDVSQEDLDAGGGQHGVTLGQLVDSHHFEVVNPEMVVFHATKAAVRRVDLRIGLGRGYVPAERQSIADLMQDEIILDSIYCPARVVNYYVEATRVGQDTDLDRLILEVTTDGRITPEEAIAQSSQIVQHHLSVFDQLAQAEMAFEGPIVPEITDREALLEQLAQKITDIELSARSANCLSGAEIDTIGELVVLSEPELLEFKNFGKKSLSEIRARLHERGLGLGMDLSRFGIDRHNIKIELTAWLKERAGRDAAELEGEAAAESLEFSDGDGDTGVDG